MRVGVVLLGAVWTGVCVAQTSEQSAKELMLQLLEGAILGYRAIPETAFPDFNDPVSREFNDRFQALYQEFSKIGMAQIVPPDAKDPQSVQRYTAQLQAYSQNLHPDFKKWARAQADEAARYGVQDPRYAAAVEDAGVVLGAEMDPDAAAYLEKASALREREGPKSVAYWKGLQRRCLAEMQRGVQNLEPCERAYEVRRTQPEATPLELASRARILAGQEDMHGNREKAIGFYRQAGEFFAKAGVSPLVTAQVFRNYTLVAVATRNGADAVKFNEMTNEYLARAIRKRRA